MTGFATDPRGTLTVGHSGAPGAFQRRLASLPARIFDLLLTWQERAEARSHLAGLNDHLLKDMGLTRADAQRESDKHFWQA